MKDRTRNNRLSKTRPGKLLVFVLSSALLLGMLPSDAIPVSKATEKTVASEAVKASHRLNNPTTDSSGVTTWDTVYFGNYWQNDTNGDGTADKNDAKEPIKWRVLSVNGDDAFLLADKNLDVKSYNSDIYVSVTWETCDMRSWLNNNFQNNAFSPVEQLAIMTTDVVNNGNSYQNIESGNDTSDKVCS